MEFLQGATRKKTKTTEHLQGFDTFMANIIQGCCLCHLDLNPAGALPVL